MSKVGKVIVAPWSISIDGFSAGPRQDVDHPLGVGGEKIMQWVFATEAFHKMHGMEGGVRNQDNDHFEGVFDNMGAIIMGRNMFGPVRGPWSSWPDEWKGWWGANPPFHVPVFVLTHHARPTLEMEGGNIFHFVTEGPEAALRRAREAAGSKDVHVGGGVKTVRQYLLAGAIDEMRLAMSPVLLGEGENLFAGIDLAKLGYGRVSFAAGDAAMHVTIGRG